VQLTGRGFLAVKPPRFGLARPWSRYPVVGPAALDCSTRFVTILRRDLPSPSPIEAGPVAVSKRTSASTQRVMVLTIVDQGASSVSNFALAILVAHYSDASAIGVFAILTTTYVIAQGVVRSLTSDCLLTRSETDDTVMAVFERGGYLAALVVSVVLGLFVLVVSGFLSSEFTIPLVIFAVAFPFMALQDFSRFIGISRNDPAYAVRLDVAWLVLFLLAYGVLRSEDLVSLPWLFGAWCGAGALVGLTTMRSHVVRHGRRLLAAWVESERGVGVRFAGQFMLVTSWSYFIVYLLVLVITLSAIGHFKLAQLSIGPITVMAAGLQAALISLGARRFQVNKHKATHFFLFAGLGTAFVTLLWTALIYFAPVHIMTSLLGPSWPQARVLVPYVGLGFALSSFSGAATSGLRAVRAAKENLRLALIMVPFLFIPCMGGAVLWGARGAAIGLCVAYSVYSILGWILLVRVVRRFEPAVIESAASEGSPEASEGGSDWTSKMSMVSAFSVHGNEEELRQKRFDLAVRPFRPDGARSVRRPRHTSFNRELTMPVNDGIDDDARSNLREYLQSLRRRQWLIILVTLGFVGLSLAYSLLTTPVYRATANLLLTPQLSTTLLQANNANAPVVTVDVPTSSQVIESTSVQSYVEKKIPNVPPVSVSEIGTTDVVQVSVDSTSPKLAARAADAYANAYIHLQQSQTVDTINTAVQLLTTHLNTVNATIAPLQAEAAQTSTVAGTALSTQLQGLQEQAVTLQNEISNDEFAANQASGGGQVVSNAAVPSKPVKPKTAEYAILAGFLGLAIGVGLALTLEFFDDGIRTKDDLELVGDNYPVLSLIPEIVDWRDPHAQYLVSRSSPSSVPAEAYRSLRTSIQFLGLDRSIKTVQFTSPSAGEGKTTTLANVAVAIAQAGQRVVVVCCDLRRPRLHQYFDMSNQIGFTSVLLGEATLREALQPVPGLEGLQILASGQIPPNPSELLSSTRTAELLASLADYADIVLIDSPPVLPVTDAVVLAGRVDAVVVVAAAGRTTQTQLSRALEVLGRVAAPIAGLVLNRASESVSFAYYRYAYGIPPEPKPSRRNATQTNAMRVPQEVG
jgi:succinoglycan biosynthesis transport protein ExoP